MPDKILICQNCINPFVYSEYEQNLNRKLNSVHVNSEQMTNNLEPLFCPICSSIKASEAKHPPKPKSS